MTSKKLKTQCAYIEDTNVNRCFTREKSPKLAAPLSQVNNVLIHEEKITRTIVMDEKSQDSGAKVPKSPIQGKTVGRTIAQDEKTEGLSLEVPIPDEEEGSGNPLETKYIKTGKDFFFQNQLDTMEEEDRKDFCADIKDGMKTRKLIRCYDVKEDFIIWAREKLKGGGGTLSHLQLDEIRQIWTTGKLSVKEIAKLKDLNEKTVHAVIHDFLNPKTTPLRDAILIPSQVVKSSGEVVPGWNPNTERPQYLLNCDSVKITLDRKSHVQMSHPSGRLSCLYNGECTCASENHNVLNFIVIGQTGVGKTTLIDTYVNYLCDISQYDKFRYRLIDEADMKKRILSERKKRKKSVKIGSSDSVTSAVTIYHIKSEWIKNYINPDRRACINIIDTPGFGDTRGLKWDRLIYEMIELTLKNLKMLDYVLLVTKSTDTRLGASTKFVFQSIQNLWAKDIAERILVMYTFSDGKAPLAEQALNDEGIITKRGFKFNNSAIWQKDDDNMITMFFNLCYSNYREFNNFIRSEDLPAISLKLTQDVLDMRKNVERISLDATRQSQALNKNMTTIKRKMKEVYANADQINQNKNYTDMVPKVKMKKLTHTGDITQCSICNALEGKGICHFGCGVGDNKINCCAINSSTRMCKRCSHSVDRHFNTRTYYKAETVLERVTVSSKKKLYDDAGRELDNVSKLITKYIDELIDMVERFEYCQQQIKSCNSWLSENAMRKKAYYSIDFFKEQIEVLKNKGDTLENEQQIESLKKMILRQEAIRNTLQGKIKVDQALNINEDGDDLEIQITKQMFKDLREEFEDYKKSLSKNQKKSQQQNDKKSWSTRVFFFL